MVRAALSGGRLGKGPRPFAAYVPAVSVAAASFLTAILPIVTARGWFPDLGFLMLIAWRLLRADAWPAWLAAPLGLFNDLLTGLPIGFSVTVWTAAMLALDLLDRRTMWRDYWIEWGLALLLLVALESAEWRLAQIMGASMAYASIVPALLIATLAFPVAGWAALKLDRWRLGR